MKTKKSVREIFGGVRLQPSICMYQKGKRVTDIALILKNNVIRNYFKIYFTTLRQLCTFLGNETFLGTKTRTIPH